LETLCYNKLKLRTWHAIVVIFPVSYPGWNVGGLKLVCTKDMSEQEKDGWKKRQVSYDPKDEAILDPIFAKATTIDNLNQNPSQNFNGSDYFEALVRDVPLHTTFIVPTYLVQSGHWVNSSFHRRIVFVPSDLFFQFILQYLHHIHCYISLKYAYEYGLKNLHLMHGLSCAWT
jgi:hypothetical protein